MDKATLHSELDKLKQTLRNRPEQTRTRLLELLAIHEKSAPPLLFARIQYLLAQAELLLGQTQQPLERLKKAQLQLADNQLDTGFQVDCLIMQATLLVRVLKFDEALSVANQAEQLACDLGEPTGLFRTKNLKGVVLKRQLRYGQAFNLFKEGLQLCNQQPDDPVYAEGIATATNNLGTIFTELEEYEASIPYYQKLLEISTRLDKTQNMAVAEYNIGLAYHCLGQSDDALPHAENAIRLSEGKSSNTSIAGYWLLSEIKYRQQFFEEAFDLAHHAKQQCESLAFENFHYYELCATIMKCLNQKEDYAQAIEMGEKALAQLSQIKTEETTFVLELERQILEYLFEAYEHSGEQNAALQVAKKLLQQIRLLADKKGAFRVFKAQAQLEIQQRDLQLQHQQELINAKTLHNEELTRLNKQLDSFVHIISHDLKAPTRTIYSFGQLLSRKVSLGLEAKKLLGFMSEASVQLSTMIDDLLQYARAGRYQNVQDEIDLNRVMRRILRHLEAEIIGCNATIKIDSLPNVVGVESALVQVFQNLVENAIKFRKPMQEPVIRIFVKSETQDKVVIVVEDNGIGIAPEKVPFIFRPFWRGEDQQQYAGNGIGLATCEKIVQEFGGQLTVESEPGKGSSFFVELVKTLP